MIEDLLSINCILTILFAWLIATPIAFMMDKSLHKKQSNVKSYKWGYFVGILGILLGGANTILLYDMSREGDTIIALGVGACVILSHFFILLRNRWIWLFAIFFQFNPILWAVNGIYLKNRWKEMGRRSGNITAINTPFNHNEKKIDNRPNQEGISQPLQSMGNKNGIRRRTNLFGFDFLKKSWIRGGVVRTLEQTGFDIKFARHIADSLDSFGKDPWNLIKDCTKGLNNQCCNMFSSMMALELYKLLNANNPGVTRVLPDINDALSQLNDAIDYQMNMGHSAEISEANRRFNYIMDQTL